MTYSVDDILLEREQRVEFINNLLYKYNMTVIFIRVNYPGLQKTNSKTEKIMENIHLLISDVFRDKIQMKEFKITAEGPNLTAVLDEKAEEIKKIAIKIENEHILGRCVDIDVYDPITLQGISRADFGMQMRKCFLCSDIAHNCVRARKHSQDEIVKYIKNTYETFTKVTDNSRFEL